MVAHCTLPKALIPKSMQGLETTLLCSHWNNWIEIVPKCYIQTRRISHHIRPESLQILFVSFNLRNIRILSTLFVSRKREKTEIAFAWRLYRSLASCNNIATLIRCMRRMREKAQKHQTDGGFDRMKMRTNIKHTSIKSGNHTYSHTRHAATDGRTRNDKTCSKK